MISIEDRFSSGTQNYPRKSWFIFQNHTRKTFSHLEFLKRNVFTANDSLTLDNIRDYSDNFIHCQIPSNIRQFYEQTLNCRTIVQQMVGAQSFESHTYTSPLII